MRGATRRGVITAVAGVVAASVGFAPSVEASLPAGEFTNVDLIVVQATLNVEPRSLRSSLHRSEFTNAAKAFVTQGLTETWRQPNVISGMDSWPDGVKYNRILFVSIPIVLTRYDDGYTVLSVRIHLRRFRPYRWESNGEISYYYEDLDSGAKLFRSDRPDMLNQEIIANMNNQLQVKLIDPLNEIREHFPSLRGRE